MPKHAWKTAALLFTLPALWGEPLDKILEQLKSEVREEQALRTMRRVWETDRWFTFPMIEETARYLESAMRDAGLQQVQILNAPADGVTQAGYWTMPLAWDVHEARLEIVEPEVEPGLRLLGDYRQTPSLVCMWSGATPPEGITAELVDGGEATAAALERMDLRGKFVLTRKQPGGVKWLLAKKGAAGAINAFTENPDLRDGRQWVNSWGDNGWALTKGNSSLPCFSITPRQTEVLESLLAQHGRVRLKAFADSKTYNGVYAYATGLVPGSGNEEVLTLGHTAEQGAHDNATGVAAMLEALGALNRLITAGKLPPPRRAIRMLAMGELYASMHYVAENTDRIRRTVAAFCVDTPAAPYEMAGTEYTFYLNPHAASSYTDAFVLHLAGRYFPSLKPKRPFHSAPFMPGTDTFLADPLIGVPTVWPYSGTGIHSHHNSEDRPETVDPRSLRDLTIVTAAYLYYLASAGEAEAGWLAELAASRGQERLVAGATRAIGTLTVSTDAAGLGGALHEARERLDYLLEREIQAVRSAARLVPAARRSKFERDVEPLMEGLRALHKDQAARLERTAHRRAHALGLRAGVRATATAGNTEAERIVVKRKRIGTLPLDEIRPDEREGQPSGAWDTRLITALYWCDGRRTLAEVIRLTRLETGPTDFDFPKYFRFLEKRGYLEFVK